MKKARLQARRVITIYDRSLCEGMQGVVMQFAGRTVAAICACLALAACGGRARGPQGQAGAGEVLGSGYLSPPFVTEAALQPGGAVGLTGHAQPGAHVQLTIIPSREKLFAEADPSGVWRLTVPALTQVSLYGLAATASGRTVQAEGWLAVTPDGHAAILRAGAGAALVARPSVSPRILALDMDRDGAAVVSGIAKPGAGLAIRIDRSPRGDVKTGPDGRFAFPLSRLGGGSHLIDVAGEGGVDAVQVSAGAPAGVGVFAGSQIAQGWRIDWTTPGAGAQVTVLITRAGGGS